ncbi:MAG: hypothetical protein KKB50_15300, partial [Planctomycetes bacterium]|nr:hypothetical protein [Planctomycetota bacterium]
MVLVLSHLLGYRSVFWYDGGQAEWAARAELPIDGGDSPQVAFDMQRMLAERRCAPKAHQAYLNNGAAEKG